MEWKENTIENKCSNPLKITGTRLASILGLSPWSTPFKTWCEITRTYKEPFEDTKYTIFGKAVEPKQADYIANNYHLEIMRPTEVFGADYFKTTKGDFFPKENIFGGMWDYLLKEDGNVSGVLEMKTTKRVEDWADDIPEYYSLQASLYAYLLDVDDVYMVCTFAEDKDYDTPNDFEVNSSNTIVKHFKVSERYPNFDGYIAQATVWWRVYVEGGASPEFDENKDKDILKALRTKVVDTNHTELETLIAEAENLKKDIDSNKASIKDTEKRYKAICDALKGKAAEQFDTGTNEVAFSGSNNSFVVSLIKGQELDVEALKNDGLYDKYLIPKETVRITVKTRKDV